MRLIGWPHPALCENHHNVMVCIVSCCVHVVLHRLISSSQRFMQHNHTLASCVVQSLYDMYIWTHMYVTHMDPSYCIHELDSCWYCVVVWCKQWCGVTHVCSSSKCVSTHIHMCSVRILDTQLGSPQCQWCLSKLQHTSSVIVIMHAHFVSCLNTGVVIT